MTTVRDFERRDRAPTLLASEQLSRPAPAVVSPASPVLNRRRSGASLVSNLSVPSSVDTRGNRRRRRPSRSNTITAYHEPEHVAEHEHFQPGAEPGVDTSAEDDKVPAHLVRLRNDCVINIIDFSDDHVSRVRCDNETLATALEAPRGQDFPCRWISVNGLSWDVIRLLGNRYGLHRLAIEDLIHTKTRTKVDWYADHAFIVLTLQKLVRMHQHDHRGRHDNCHFCASDTSSEEDEDIDEKFEKHGQHRHQQFWQKWWKPRRSDVLPTYLDRDHDGKMDEYVSAHSGTSEDTPVTAVRTLHRYESAQIPEHTAWMERHSALAQEDLAVSVEQVSIFLLSDNSVISFFEHSAEDVERPILERLHSETTMLRRSCDASLLTQAIIDAIVDLAVPVRDAYNKSRKELQIDAMTNPNIRTSRALHIFGEEIDMLQNLFKPIVHLVNSLRDHGTTQPAVIAQMAAPATDSMPPTEQGRPTQHRPKRDREGMHTAMRMNSDFRKKGPARPYSASVSITPLAHTYFGDVLDHCITMIAALEQMDASANNISTLIFNTVGANTNRYMFVLAIVTVFFAPLTFISGYFGMNFAEGQGLKHPFRFFWVVAGPALVAFMLLVFGVMLQDQIVSWAHHRGIKAGLRVPRPLRRR